MSETKWTPGPWEAFYDENEGRHRILAGDALPDDDGEFPGFYHTANSIDWEHGIYPEDYEHERVDATSRLIAAAPELYEALEKIKGLYDTPVERQRRRGDEFYAEAMRVMNAAMKKARGEQG